MTFEKVFWSPGAGNTAIIASFTDPINQHTMWVPGVLTFYPQKYKTFISWIKTSTRHTFEHVKTNLCHISLRFTIGRKNKQKQFFFSG